MPLVKNILSTLRMYEDNKVLKEKDLQRDILSILRESGFLVWHNNNNSLNKVSGSNNKRQGVLAGVLDLTLVLQGEVMFIELKTLKGTLSKDQKEFIKSLEEREIKYKVLKGVQEFEDFYNELTGGSNEESTEERGKERDTNK